MILNMILDLTEIKWRKANLGEFIIASTFYGRSKCILILSQDYTEPFENLGQWFSNINSMMSVALKNSLFWCSFHCHWRCYLFYTNINKHVNMPWRHENTPTYIHLLHELFKRAKTLLQTEAVWLLHCCCKGCVTTGDLINYNQQNNKV